MATAKDEGNTSQSDPDDHGGADDLISSLSDDVLLRILGLVADARAVVRTGALSRRWRGLWTRAAALRFDSWPEFLSARGAARYLVFVGDVLALRAAGSDAVLEHLSISFVMDCGRNLSPLVPASITAAQSWIRYAMNHGVKSLALDLRLPPPKPEGRGYVDDPRKPLMVLDDLPGSTELETMRLALDGARVQLPATQVYASLTDLLLESIHVVGSGVDLAVLLSPASCPSMERLSLKNLRFSSSGELRIESGVLTELWLENVYSLEALDVRTPRLRFFHVEDCHHEVLRISTPSLEEFRFVQTTHPLQHPLKLEVDGDLLSVRRLKLRLDSYQYPDPDSEEAIKDVNLLLLEHCSSVTSLELILHVATGKLHGIGIKMIEGNITIPLLSRVKCLTIHVSRWVEPHAFGAGMARFLAQFSNLRSLRVNFDCGRNPDSCNISCYVDLDRWRCHNLSLTHLQEIELRGLRGTDCELKFLEFIVRSAAGLRKVTTSFSLYDTIRGSMRAFHLAMRNGGTWTSRRYRYPPFDSRPYYETYLQGQVHVYVRNNMN